MTQHEVKCTPNNQCKCIVLNEKQGMLLGEMKNLFKWQMQSFLYESVINTSLSKPSASTMQNAKCNDA